MADALKADNRPQATYLKDYRPPDFLIDTVDLDFRLDAQATRVKSRLVLRRNGAHDRPLTLHGVDLTLIALARDGKALTPRDYDLDADGLTIARVPDAFTLDIETEIAPARNTQLSGLYVSGGNFCTQCEAEGFRRITYFLDRPDVMARFRVRLEADKARYPVLLSNGNPDGAGDLADGRHWARWHDPHPKPAYLFALVAGELVTVRDHFTTMTGRPVELAIHVAARDIDKCGHAMESLKRAMRWDEEQFGLAYDLDVYNIVAVSDFNMGAMENKGLNIFNTRYVLAKPETATDADYDGVESVIAHEYFHNWTGNRVTCRDWFQLSLKEGLTVFRDQQFSADMGSAGLKRIEDVRALRAHQFPEDAGPMAHPVRPESYIEINNFYTATVYNKGAEVIRMMHTLLGADGFRRGMDLYFARHDGQAVTCDDFVAAMADATGHDLDQFKRWYVQAGTPRLTVTSAYDAARGTFSLDVAQTLPDTPGQTDKQPMVVPLKTALFAPDGTQMETRLEDACAREHLLVLREHAQHFVFEGVTAPPVPSILRGFSAPVKLETDLTPSDLAFLARHDSDPFNRWEAFQTLAVRSMLAAVVAGSGERAVLDPLIADAIAATLASDDLDPAMKAEAVLLPAEPYLAEQMALVDVAGIHAVRESLRRQIGDAFAQQWQALHESGRDAVGNDRPVRARRRLKNVALGYLVATGTPQAVAMAREQAMAADNMTDELAALGFLAHVEASARVEALAHFYEKWKHDALVIDKWFSIQAMSMRPQTLEAVIALTRHPDFTRRNPNRLRALVGAFSAANQVRFHDAGGGGYRFLADEVIAVDAFNPQTAARLLAPLARWRRFDAHRAALMKAQLERILAREGLSKDVYEIASKGLQ
ncbi:MAG: aminopeptidase N [Alphaproteobacteria bacterium]|nr:MAG: aminopeptidase N [Alphaproteobacteria bacterium]